MKTRIYSGLILLFVLTQLSFSQLGISIKVGPMLGMTSPTVDYGGDVKDFYSGTKYGLRSGINYGAMGKLTLGPLNGRVSISYASLDNSGVANLNQPNSTLEVKQNIFLITLGTEFGFGIPFSPVKPYAGIDVLFSSISGTFKYQGTSNVNSNENSISSSSRTGLGFSIGSEIQFGKTITMDLSLRYNLHNLFGKEYKVISNSNRIDAYTSLNDAIDPNYSATDDKHPVGNDRTIATIQLQLGILFGF